MSKTEERIAAVLVRHGLEPARGLVAELAQAAKQVGNAPAAVEVYREAAGRYPPKSLWPYIAEAVGDDAQALMRWRVTVLAYVGCGWNPANVTNQLGYFQRRALPAGNGRNHGAYLKDGAAPHVPGNGVSPEGLEAARRLAGGGRREVP